MVQKLPLLCSKSSSSSKVLVQVPGVHTECNFGCSILVCGYLISGGINLVSGDCSFPYDVFLFPFLPTQLCRVGDVYWDLSRWVYHWPEIFYHFI